MYAQVPRIPGITGTPFPAPLLLFFPSLLLFTSLGRAILNWFSFGRKTNLALSKLQMLLPTGKSITINQVCWEKAKPWARWDASIRGGMLLVPVKNSEGPSAYGMRCSFLLKRFNGSQFNSNRKKSPPMTPYKALPNQESISMELVRSNYWLAVSIHERPMPRRVEGVMHHYTGSTRSTQPNVCSVSQARAKDG